MSPILSASNLQFLDLISYPEISIEKNKLTFICGESGCGKSTLLKLFNATVSPSSGNIYFNGINIEALDTILLRRKVLLCSQDAYLFDSSIQENFDEYYRYREQTPISEAQIEEFLKLCCADFPLNLHCSNLSGGERQRVFLAICLSFNPEVLMMDEPTSALDSPTAMLLMNQLREYCSKEDITLVTVSHDQKLLESFADNVIMLGK